MEVNLKAGICKDSNNQAISPVTSSRTVYNDDGNSVFNNIETITNELNTKATVETLNDETLVNINQETIISIINNINNDIGETADTGGNESSGSVYAKLNKILENLTTVIENINNSLSKNEIKSSTFNGEVLNDTNEIVNITGKGIANLTLTKGFSTVGEFDITVDGQKINVINNNASIDSEYIVSTMSIGFSESLIISTTGFIISETSKGYYNIGIMYI